MWEAVEAVSDPSPRKYEQDKEDPDDAEARHTEDLAGQRGCVAWMLDGASAVSSRRVVPQYPSDAWWLVHRLNEALHLHAADDTATLQEIVSAAIRRTAAWAIKEWTGEPDIPPSAALGIIRRCGDETEYLVLADISIIFAGREEIVDLRVEESTEHLRTSMRTQLKRGLPVHEVKERTRDALAEHRRTAMNRHSGYWVASLDEDVVAHAVTGRVTGAHEVVLATDGFMRVLRPFALINNVDELFHPECSLEALARRVREAEHADLDLAYTRWTEWDDICARRLRWVENSEGAE
jgi:hypothetical protein